MNQMNNELVCPKCRGKELATRKQSGYAKMSSGHLNLGSNIPHTICHNCGFIVESQVKKPEDLSESFDYTSDWIISLVREVNLIEEVQKGSKYDV